MSMKTGSRMYYGKKHERKLPAKKDRRREDKLAAKRGEVDAQV